MDLPRRQIHHDDDSVACLLHIASGADLGVVLLPSCVYGECKHNLELEQHLISLEATISYFDSHGFDDFNVNRNCDVQRLQELLGP